LILCKKSITFENLTGRLAQPISGFESYETFDDFINGFTFNDISIATPPILLDQ